MANRKQRRKDKNYVKAKNYNEFKLSEEAKSGIKITLVILVIIVLVYFATVYLVNKGNLSTYEPSKTTSAVITYDQINIGMVFNRQDEEYYVAFEEFGDKNKVEYNTIIRSYSSKDDALPIYKVDMSLGYNRKYSNTNSNKYAQDARELQISTPTLMKVKNKTNVLYIEDMNKIKSELGV